MVARYEGPASPELLEVRREIASAEQPLAAWASGAFRFRAHVCDRNLWLVLDGDDGQPLALRAASVWNGHLRVHHVEEDNASLRIEAISDIGAFRITIDTRTRDELTTLRCRTMLLPTHDLRMSFQPRDLFVLETQGESPQTGGRLYSTQHGFQTGSLFAASAGGAGSSIYYVQNFSSLQQYFEDTRTTPKDSVGGSWPEIGFLLPTSEDHPLLASNEYTISDSYVVLRARAPISEGEAARYYLDALAHVASMLEAPPRSYHDWPQRAHATVYDLSQSPECAIEIGRNRYLAPYVNTKNKPPESMVQLTVLVALAEFEKWAGSTFALTRDLLDGLGTFMDPGLNTIVRWLPGERFNDREDEHQTHEAMDSWYLYHVLFNLTRLAAAGSKTARELLDRSLPYAIRAAKRFAYRWPIFFNLKTLDVIQAEAAKGSGGENDVSGLYALVMLHAYEIYGDEAYLEEAKQAADAMEGFGFSLAYQANTTGFAAEAMLRLWKLTGDRRYFDLTMVALANVFDNMSLWEPRYGNAKWYSTYFGLYPLRGAPYIAAYEELEALAKFHEFLRLGGGDLPESVRLLMSEFSKSLLSRAWQYYPDTLPPDMLSQKVRNGAVRRELSIPLEDLQDGLQPSGQVGQEIYGAGLALVCTTRHYRRIPGRPLMLYCEYPLEEVGRNRFRVLGSAKMHCLARLISTDPNIRLLEDAISITGSKRHKFTRSVEGHITVDVRGDDVIAVKTSRRKSAAK